MTTPKQKPIEITEKEALHGFQNRNVLYDGLSRRKKAEHLDKDGQIAFTDTFYHKTNDSKHPEEIKRTYATVSGKQRIDTFVACPTDKKEVIYRLIKSKFYRNGEVSQSVYYNPNTHARTKERLYRRDKTGFLLMTENRYDKTGTKIVGTRRMVNINGQLHERTPKLDKMFNLDTRPGLRSTLAKQQTVKVFKDLLNRFIGGKSA